LAGVRVTTFLCNATTLCRNMRDVIIIKDPEVAKLFADETRRRILHHLRHRELSATDLAEILGKSHSSIIHHLKLLQDAGLVEESRTERRRNLIQSYYRSTAKMFIISYTLTETLGDMEVFPWSREVLRRMLDGLREMGYDYPEGEEEKILELIGGCYIKEQRALEEIIERQRTPVKVDRHIYFAMTRLLTMLRLSGDEEYMSMVGKLRELLKGPNRRDEGDG